RACTPSASPRYRTGGRACPTCSRAPGSLTAAPRLSPFARRPSCATARCSSNEPSSRNPHLDLRDRPAVEARPSFFDQQHEAPGLAVAHRSGIAHLASVAPRGIAQAMPGRERRGREPRRADDPIHLVGVAFVEMGARTREAYLAAKEAVGDRARQACVEILAREAEE